jgi:serine/threonine-protein kinase
MAFSAIPFPERDSAPPNARRSGTNEIVRARDGTMPLIDGRYLLEREIARGGMGVVHLASDVTLGRQIALKLIDPELAGDRSVVDRFQREATALASIRHQNVVQIHAFGSEGDAIYFAMEYVRGRNLDEIIGEHARRGLALPTHRALTILRQIAEGLAAVHAAGIVHRDVKPANVVIENDSGRPVLVDFGLALPAERRATLPPLIAGSPSYMAPEQAHPDLPLGPAADVYAFGVTAFELLTGRLPFEEEELTAMLQAHAARTPPLVSSYRPGLRPFDRIVARMLAKDPRERYEGFATLLAALDGALARWRAGSMEPAPSWPDGGGPGRGELLKILIVDGDETFRKSAARATQLAFYRRAVRVSVARNGSEALAKAERIAPDLVLLDHGLDPGGLDAIETLSRLRALPRGTEARVLIVTDRGSEDDRWRYALLGVRDFFERQTGLVELVQSITEVGERWGFLGSDEERDDEPPSSARWA